MRSLLGPHDPPKPEKPPLPPGFRFAAWGSGAVAVVLGLIFWKELLLIGMLLWMKRPHPIRTLLLRSDTPFHSARASQQEKNSEPFFPTYGRERILTMREPAGGESGFLLSWSLKTSDPNGPGQSLTRDWGVYRYDPVAKSLKQISGELWDRSDGEILECRGWMLPRSQWNISIQRNDLRVDHFAIPFEGTKLVGIAQAPTRPWLAVVSAADSIPGFAFPGLGGSTAGAGQYYHQVFSLDGRKPIGPPIRLPSHTDQFGEMTPKMCWSPDESHVIYARLFEGMSIVAVDPD